MNINTEETTGSRIARLQKKYRDCVPVISTERARFFTESWRETEGKGLSRGVRSAMAMKRVYENMTHYLDPDDRIAGYWTESFTGMPIDIERGVFNKVLKTELYRRSLIMFRVRSTAETLSFLVRKRRAADFVRGIAATGASGPRPLNLKIETMSERNINRFEITDSDRRLLNRELLPYWEGRTAVDTVEKRLMSSGLLKGDMKDFAMSLPANTSRQTFMVSVCSTISSYQGHVILDYEKVLKLGLRGIMEEIQSVLNGNPAMPDTEREFLESARIAVEGVMIFAARLTDRIKKELEIEKDPARRAELEEMLAACNEAPMNPARGFRQAVQAAWTVKTAVELAHPVNLHSFGRMDQMLLPYYEEDIRAGRITREAAGELLQELLLKIMSQNMRPETNVLSGFYHRYLGSTPVTVGGLKPDGTDGTNELTDLFIEAADKARAVTNLSVRVHPGTPEATMLKVAETLHGGGASISLFNDEVNVEAMRRRGFAEGDALDYAVMGCVEMLCPGKTGGMSANALLLCRLLDVTLHNGDARTIIGTLKDVGLKTGAPDSFGSFEALFEAYVEQAKRQIELLVAASNLRDEIFAESLPAPCISAFIDGCVENRCDVTRGGARYDLTGISFINSIANAADSLYAIKKLVFERREFSLGELVTAIDANFAGHEKIQSAVESLEGKWGNGCDESDGLVHDLTDRLFEETYKYKSYRGGAVVPYVISMTTHTIDGRVSAATPDGRRAYTPFAASCNPYNVDRNGPTALLRSVAAIDFRHVLGCAVNVKFHPTAIGKDIEARRKWVALMRAYFRLGGAQIQPTVASAETLRAAQRNPREFGGLIVKVGGYSAYFTELGIEIQNEVIARTEQR